MSIFVYGEREISHLKARDKKLGQVIQAVGHIKRPVTKDLFFALIDSIVSQQISKKAAQTVINRLEARAYPFTPDNINKLSAEEIQSCGMTLRKAVYIKDIAEKIQNGALDLKALNTMEEEEIVKRLTALKGIGLWTAQMLMLFSMERQNILSYDDLAIQRGLRMVYHHKEITKSLFEKYKKRYSPYCSVASLYLWEVAGGALGMKDYAPIKKQKAKGANNI